MQHTREPWEIHKYSHAENQLWLGIGHHGWGPICDVMCTANQPSKNSLPENYLQVAEFKYLVTKEEEQFANAQRIIDCVNGCAGIKNPEGIKELIVFCKSLLIQRTQENLHSIDFMRIQEALERMENNKVQWTDIQGYPWRIKEP